MILSIFILFLSLSFVLIITAKYTDIKVLETAGFVMIFILGLIVLFSNISYKTGYNENYVYGSNFTDYHWEDYNGSSPAPSFNPSADVIFLFHTERNYTYSNFEGEIINGLDVDHIIGFLLLIIGAFGFINSYFNWKNNQDMEGNYNL